MEREDRASRGSKNADLKESAAVTLDDGEGKLLNAKALGVKDSNAVETALGDLLERG